MTQRVTSSDGSGQRVLRVFLASRDRPLRLSETPNVCVQVSEETPAEDSLRDAAVLLADSGHGQGDPASWVTFWFGSVHQGMAGDSSTYHDVEHETFYMRIFAVRQDGSAVFRESLADLTWGDIWRAMSDGLYPTSVRDQVVITDDGGWGGGFDQFWLGAAAFLTPEIVRLCHDVVVGTVTAEVVRRATLPSRKAPRKVRRQARIWAEQGFDQPYNLVDYLYQRQRWTAELLASRLRLEEPADARALLHACAWVTEPDNIDSYVTGELRTAQDCLTAWHEAQRLIDDGPEET